MPLPPYSSSTVMPSRPMSPNLRHRSAGNSLSRSICGGPRRDLLLAHLVDRVAQHVEVFAEAKVEGGVSGVHGGFLSVSGGFVEGVARLAGGQRWPRTGPGPRPGRPACPRYPACVAAAARARCFTSSISECSCSVLLCAGSYMSMKSTHSARVMPIRLPRRISLMRTRSALEYKALLALPQGADQALFLVEADGAGGNPEFLGQFGDGVGLAGHGDGNPVSWRSGKYSAS